MPNFTPYLIAWILLILTVIFLAVYRKNLSSKEDDSLHLNAGEGALVAQENLAHKLATIDKWGKILTVVAALGGIALASWYVYYVWTNASTIMTK
jgi:hypothetical protein